MTTEPEKQDTAKLLADLLNAEHDARVRLIKAKHALKRLNDLLEG